MSLNVAFLKICELLYIRRAALIFTFQWKTEDIVSTMYEEILNEIAVFYWLTTVFCVIMEGILFCIKVWESPLVLAGSGGRGLTCNLTI